MAVGYASDAAARQDALDMERTLSELRAKAVPLSREAYPAVWKLADNTFTPDTSWTAEIRVPLREQARDAEDELRLALERLASVAQ